MLFVFVVLFWAAFEQAGGLMNIYANDKTDRMVGSFEVPAGWFQSLNPLFIVLLAPIFSAAWSKLGAVGRNPATPRKMVLGLVLPASASWLMVAAALESEGGGKAAMSWLVIAYFFHTTGELCISPVGLSMVTKLAPLRLASLMMGVWFLINFVANWLAGIIGSYAESLGEITIFGGLAAHTVRFRRRAVDAVRDARALDARRRDHPPRLMPSSPPRNHAAAPFPRSTRGPNDRKCP